MLYAVLEEAEGAVVKVEQHTDTIALLVFACCIFIRLAVAVEGTVISRRCIPCRSSLLQGRGWAC
jgi:hypothetical protein